MDNIAVRFSESTVERNQIYLLEIKNNLFVDADIEVGEDSYTFNYTVRKLLDSSIISDKSIEDKFRFCMNIAKLSLISSNYTFSLSLDNLMVNLNLEPSVLVRDIGINDSFISMYKSVIATIIEPKYTYDQYLTGDDLFKKNKILTSIYNAQNVDEVVIILEEQYKKAYDYRITSTKVITKDKLNFFKVSIPVLIGIILLIGVVLGFTASKMSTDGKILMSYRQFYNGEKVKAIENVREVDFENMTIEDKIMLVQSTVSLEPITVEKQENILNSISVNSPEEILDYWLLIGTGKHVEAVEQARKINDQDLLLYGLIRNLEIVEESTVLTGTEKQEEISKLSSEIDTLQEEKEQK